MTMRKLYLVGLLSVTLLICTVFGVWVAKFERRARATVGMKLVVSYELEIRYSGEPLITYDWGDFDPEEKKWVYLDLSYPGIVNAEVWWNTTDFPSGWDLNIKASWGNWAENGHKQVFPGDSSWLNVTLAEIDGVPNQQGPFNLNFYWRAATGPGAISE